MKRKLFKHFILMAADLSKNCSTGCNFFHSFAILRRSGIPVFVSLQNLWSLIEAKTAKKEKMSMTEKYFCEQFLNEYHLPILEDSAQNIPWGGGRHSAEVTILT